MPYGLDLLKNVGGQAASGIVGEGLGLLTQGIKNRQQVKQAKRLQEVQIAGDKELTDYNMAKQLQMWKDTSYGAQVEQMNKAGINPAIMYGMGGGGGQTTGQANGSVSGQSAETAKKTQGGEGMGLMIGQMELLKAQKENIEADTRNKEADTLNKPKVGANLEASTKSLTEGLNNQKAEQGLLKAQKELVGSQDSKVKREEQELWMTQDSRVKIYSEEAAQNIVRTKQMLIQLGIDEKTANDKVKILAGEAVQVVLENELLKANKAKVLSDIGLNQATIAKMAEDINMGWSRVDQDERKTFIMEKVGHFNSAQSQRTYENILSAVDRILGAVKPINVQTPPARNPIGFQF